MRGSAEVPLLFTCEPGPAEAMCREVGEVAVCPPRPAGTPFRMRGSLPTQMALERGFAVADFVVQAEEDFVVSSDLLEFFRWAAAACDLPGIAAVCSTHGGVWPGGPGDVRLVPGFRSGVWGTWRDRWEQTACWGYDAVDGMVTPWDLRLQQQWRSQGQLCAFPVLARSQHIGVVSSLSHPELAEYTFGRTQAAQFQMSLPATSYRLPDEEMAWLS